MSYYPGQNHQLRYSLAIALVLHGLALFGIAFVAVYSVTQINQKEVTLSIATSKDKPAQADFIAQTNQQGSGQLEQAKELSSTTEALLTDTQINDVKPLLLPQQSATSQAKTRARIITTTADSIFYAIVKPKPTQQLEEQQKPEHTQKTLAELSLEIASLEARLSQKQQTHSKKPRVMVITSASALAAEDAAYVHQWRDRVETVGNLHYPDKAREKSLYGDVRLLVKLLANGLVEEISILSSSGSSILDRAAIESIRLASPFEPFHDALAKKYDRIDVIRTWQFRKDRLSAKSN